MRIEEPDTVEVIGDGACVIAWRHDRNVRDFLLKTCAHHGITFRSRTNLPVNLCGASRASQTGVSAPSVTSRSALRPPMSMGWHEAARDRGLPNKVIALVMAL